MQNVSLSKYTQIGNLDGIYFMWDCLSVNNPTISSISILCQHSKSYININPFAAITLFKEMSIIASNDIYYSINDNFISYKNCSKDTFIDWFSKSFIQFLFQNSFIDFTKISYDRESDKYVFSRTAISFKFACLRNLLISLGILSKARADGQFYIDKYIYLFFDKGKEISRKMSLQKLLNNLDKQQEQGEKGEKFVINYENNRLKGHPRIKDIKQISQIDVCAGFDIVSFDNLNSDNLDRMIEVKTFEGTPHFYWSSNERKQAALIANHYYIYMVDYSKIKTVGYEPVIIQKPIEYFKNNPQWLLIDDTIKVILNDIKINDNE